MHQAQIIKTFPTVPEHYNGTSPFNKVKDDIVI